MSECGKGVSGGGKRESGCEGDEGEAAAPSRASLPSRVRCGFRKETSIEGENRGDVWIESQRKRGRVTLNCREERYRRGRADLDCYLCICKSVQYREGCGIALYWLPRCRVCTITRTHRIEWWSMLRPSRYPPMAFARRSSFAATCLLVAMLLL